MDTRHITTTYAQAIRRLFLLDYDGTLVGFAPTPAEAVPPVALLAVLARLAADPKNTLVVVSGRDCATLEAWLGHLPIALVAEHGFFAKQPAQPWEACAAMHDSWKHAIRPLLTNAVQRVPGSMLEEKATSIVWHYRNAVQPEVAVAELTSTLAAVRQQGIMVVPGNKIIEVRLANVHKGQAATRWLQAGGWGFTLAAGDDTTDEDLFAALPPSAHTVKVGAGESAARHRVAGPPEFVALLRSLATRGGTW